MLGLLFYSLSLSVQFTLVGVWHSLHWWEYGTIYTGGTIAAFTLVEIWHDLHWWEYKTIYTGGSIKQFTGGSSAQFTLVGVWHNLHWWEYGTIYTDGSIGRAPSSEENMSTKTTIQSMWSVCIIPPPPHHPTPTLTDTADT